jgi:GntR family transcriptional regulator, transcriptional repressor for pyruvate dehydrogenase complex
MVSPPTPDQVSNSLTPISRESLKDRIVVQIKNLMFSNKIQVGQRLPAERDLAARFQVSRVVVREALKSLQQSGLVEIRTGGAGGAYAVSDLHIPFFYAVHDLMNAGHLSSNHFWEFGEMIERTGARLAAKNATPQDAEQLVSLNKKLISDESDPYGLLQVNREFHLAVAQISGNPLIKLTVHSLFKMHDILSSGAGYPSQLRKEIFTRHEGIINAIMAKDDGLAEQLMAADAKKHEQFMAGNVKNWKNPGV